MDTKVLNQQRRRFSILGKPRPTNEQRFWSKVNTNGPIFINKKNESSNCWIWTGTKSDGYGYFHVTEYGMIQAHLFSLRLFGRYIPPKRECDHLCRNRDCVNPAHLEITTHRVNVKRGIGPTAENSKKEFCKYGHKFTEANTRFYATPTGTQRICRACERIKSHYKYQERRKL